MRTPILKSAASTALLCSLLGLSGCLSSGGSGSKSGNDEVDPDAPFAFQPIILEKMDLPPGFGPAGNAVFLPDGEHVVAQAMQGSTPHLILGNVETGETECVTCTATAEGEVFQGVGLVNPFPDGKRLLFGLTNRVFECAPSLIDCQAYKILPYELPFPDNAPVPYIGAQMKLAPDGEHVGYSNVTIDGLLEMVVGKLVRQDDKYIVEDLRVINPPGPSSLDDPSIERWSEGAALYELKTFTRGGAAAVYVQAGGANAFNPDIWEVDLKTGERTRLTAHPDWDEDMAMTPDGELLNVWSSRGYDVYTWAGGLFPFRSFIDAAAAVSMTSRLTNSPGNLYCAGPQWLLPATGDEGGSLSGQPIINLKYDDARVTVNVLGAPTWSRDSNRLALTVVGPGGGVYGGEAPSFLLFAHLPAKEAGEPLPVVETVVGDWAPRPGEYKSSFSYSGTVTLDGPGGGTVTVTYSPSGIGGPLQGKWTQVYENYSEDGESFINGAMSVDHRKPFFGELQYVADLTMTGKNTGYLNLDVTVSNPGDDTRVSVGSSVVNYNGTTVTGLPIWMDDDSGYCPEQQTPTLPQLDAQLKSLGDDEYEVKVTASIGRMGQDQTAVSTSPVRHALISGSGVEVYTDGYGVARFKAAAGTQLDVTAGDTLAPTKVSIGG